MRLTCLTLLVAWMVLFIPAGRLWAADDAELAEDEKLLKDAKLPVDGPGLLDFFRKAMLSEADQKRIPDLIRKLGDDDFATRDKASKDLLALGVPALPHLRKGLTNPDAEVQRQLKNCIETLEGIPHVERSIAAAHVLRARKPADAVPVLLAYLPFADNADVDMEIVLTLVTLGMQDGKVHADLAAALQDKAPARRGAAALVVGRSGTAEQRVAVRRLLTDPDARVRWRAAQGLISARDKSATPALLALLAEAPLDTAREAEELLGRLAGDRAPAVALSAEDAARRKCLDAWQQWWKANEARLDLAKADVDVVSVSPDKLAKDVARKFVDGITKHDTAMVVKSIDVPFEFMGMQTFTTREELAKMFSDRPAANQPKITIVVTKMITADEYAKKLPAGFDPANKFLEKIRKSKARLVYMQIDEGGRPEGVVFIVRLVGGKARVTGLGMAEVK